MYIILVYDINAKRVNKVLKVARRYLRWVQNSVLEGEITEASFRCLKFELSRITKENEDVCVFYIFRTNRYLKRESLGMEKGNPTSIISGA